MTDYIAYLPTTPRQFTKGKEPPFVMSPMWDIFCEGYHLHTKYPINRMCKLLAMKGKTGTLTVRTLGKISGSNGDIFYTDVGKWSKKRLHEDPAKMFSWQSWPLLSIISIKKAIARVTS